MSSFNHDFEEHGIEVVHHMPAGDGVYLKQVLIPEGKVLSMHEHTFEHKSVLAQGTAVVTIDDVDHVLIGPQVIQVKDGKKHSVTALTDVVWLCVHATEETDPERIDHTLVKES